MDILQKYNQSREELQALAKDIFTLLEQNDPYKIILLSDLARVEILDHKDDPSLVVVALLNHSDIVPKVSFDSPRELTLQMDNVLIKCWLEESRKIIERSMYAIGVKFLKHFSQDDFIVIKTVIDNYAKLAQQEKTDQEIAQMCAKVITERITDKIIQGP